LLQQFSGRRGVLIGWIGIRIGWNVQADGD
jgi:hypothetical protein